MGGVKDDCVSSGINQHADPLYGVRLDAGCSGDHEAALAVLGGDWIVLDLHEVLIGDQADQLAVSVYHGKFLDLASLEDLGCLRESDSLGGGHNVLGGHDVAHWLCHVLLEPEVPVRYDSDQESIAVHHGDSSDMMLAHHCKCFADSSIRTDSDWIVDHAVLSPLDPADLFALLLDRHVLMDNTDSTGPCHGNSQVSLSHSVHCGRHDRSVKFDVGREPRRHVHVAGKYIGMSRNQQHVIEGQSFGNLSVNELRHCDQFN